jgi:hypothetical protein
MTFEKYVKMVIMHAFMDTNQTVVNVGLGSGIIKDTLGYGILMGPTNCTVGQDFYLACFCVQG